MHTEDSRHGRFSTHGGGIDQTAIIGHPPEHRDWKPGDPALEPDIHPPLASKRWCPWTPGSRCRRGWEPEAGS
jgi:hypothetical protein